MNCKLYLLSKKLLVTLSQHRSGGSFAASQNTEKSSLSFFGACAQLPAKVLVWMELLGEGAGPVSLCLIRSHQRPLCVHNELSFAVPVLGQHASPHTCPVLCWLGPPVNQWHKAESICLSLLILWGIQTPWNKMFSTVVTNLVWNAAFLFSSNHAWNQKCKHLGVMGFLCKNDCNSNLIWNSFQFILQCLWVESIETVFLWGGRGKTCQGAKWNDKLLAHWNYGYPVSCVL